MTGPLFDPAPFKAPPGPRLDRSASLSPDGRYRWKLGRRWDDDGPTMAFVMLNPSTADANVDDPTIRRCIGFARREGCGALVVVNLSAYRATRPQDLPWDDDSASLNRHKVRTALSDPDVAVVVAAWGAHARRADSDGATRSVVARFNPQCLGTTLTGHPRHPLYLRADTPLEPWSAR